MVQNRVIFLTPEEMARSLNIHTVTLEAMVTHRIIPHTWIKPPESKEYQLRFNTWDINEWLKEKPVIDFTGDYIINSLQEQYKKEYPEVLDNLKKIDEQFAPRKEYKGYSLKKVKSKKHGFLYYVRYNGITTQRNTWTNNKDVADAFAIANKDRILAEYDRKKKAKNSELYKVLKAYYEEKSSYLEEDKVRGRVVNVKTCSVYRNFINKIFIPYLKEKKVMEFDDLTAPVVANLQTYLLKKGNKRQTVNHYFGGLRAAFENLVLNGIINENVFKKVKGLNEKGQRKVTGCYEISNIYGVFNRKWHDENSYLLNLMIYGTNMRNGEIEKVQVKDFMQIGDCWFLDIPASKTESGVRIVPIHPYMYSRIMDYVRKTEKGVEDYIFSAYGGHNQSTLYRKAKIQLGEKLGKTAEELDRENIRFYSGRSYWKTLMSENGLGDVEEYFMGHKVTNIVAKLYNRKDRLGQRIKIKKAKEVFAIQDKTLFKGRKTGPARSRSG